MGHKSIIEHDYLVFALCDVTPIVEQTIIGNRLTSFTIKSRREVDFRNAGFYVPEFRNKDLQPHEKNEDLKEKYNHVFQNGFVSMDMAQNILVVKTVPGMAMAVAAALDAMECHEIVGSIAGDDTVM